MNTNIKESIPTAWDRYYAALGKPTDCYGIGDMSRKNEHTLELKLKWASRVAVVVAVVAAIMSVISFSGGL